MIPFNEWFADIGGKRFKWCILGKGPSFQLKGNFDLSGYKTAALNHVIRELDADVSSVIDLEVIRDCGDAISSNARYLIMPRFPHQNMVVVDRPLETYLDEYPVLRKMSDQGRLVWYNLATNTKTAPFSGAPLVGAISFNSEAVVSLLGESRVKTIRTLGVDGGTNYAPSFSDLNTSTLLANGQPNFDVQFSGLAKAIREFDLDFAPLTSSMPCIYYIPLARPVPIIQKLVDITFAQTDPISSKVVYESDLTSIASSGSEVDIIRSGITALMREIVQNGGDRLLVFQGYPVINTRLREVWELSFDGAAILYPKSLGISALREANLLLLNIPVILKDLASPTKAGNASRVNLTKLIEWYAANKASALSGVIPKQWQASSSIDISKGSIRCYPNSNSAPWKTANAAYGSIWEQELKRAIQAGGIEWIDLVEAVRNGEVRRSLLTQLELSEDSWDAFKQKKALLQDLYWNILGKHKYRLLGNR